MVLTSDDLSKGGEGVSTPYFMGMCHRFVGERGRGKVGGGGEGGSTPSGIFGV